MDLFLQNLPKIELHAHLNGSLNINGIKLLGQQLYGENSTEFLRLCERFTDFTGTDLDGCFKKFAFMHELTSTPKGLKLACEMVIRNFCADNVVYLELRTTPKANEYMTRREYVELLIQAIKECSVQLDIQVKLLLSIDRAQSVPSAEEIVDLAVGFSKEYPDILKGVDLSGNPNKGKFADFLNVLSKAKQSNLYLALHCAEVHNSEESQQMIDFGFQRCGHGTFLSDSQLRQCQEKSITIECCLTSNVKCATVASYDSHHFKHIFERGINAVICTDDCGVFDTTLTQELKLACKYFNLTKNDIYKLSLYAIDGSFANQNEKKLLRKLINNYFE